MAFPQFAELWKLIDLLVRKDFRQANLAGKLCRKNNTLSSLAVPFGVKISGLNMARDKIARRIDNVELIENVSEIENMLKIRYDSV